MNKVIAAVLLTLSVKSILAATEGGPIEENGVVDAFEVSEIVSEIDPYLVFMPEPQESLNFTQVQRIINGREAIPHFYPYQVGMEILLPGGWTWCGGSIVSQNYVLTAAHCVDKASYLYVIFGAHDRLNPSEAGQVRQYVDKSRIKVHEDWNSSALVNDIAAIHLPVPIIYTGHILPISLPPRSELTTTKVGDVMITTGWGWMKGSSSVARFLQYANVNVMDLKLCQSYLRQVVSTNICIDGRYGLGVCYGDSGSPMVTSTGTKYLIGITSFVSAGGCEINYPSVYTRVSAYLDWISTNTGIPIR